MCEPFKQLSTVDRVEIIEHLTNRSHSTFSFTQTAHQKPLTTNVDVDRYMSMTTGDMIFG
jgi:predicted metallopeptidase